MISLWTLNHQWWVCIIYSCRKRISRWRRPPLLIVDFCTPVYISLKAEYLWPDSISIFVPRAHYHWHTTRSRAEIPEAIRKMASIRKLSLDIGARSSSVLQMTVKKSPVERDRRHELREARGYVTNSFPTYHAWSKDATHRGYPWVLKIQIDSPDAMKCTSRLSIRRQETSETGGDLFEALSQVGRLNIEVIDLNGMAQRSRRWSSWYLRNHQNVGVHFEEAKWACMRKCRGKMYGV